MLWDSARHPLYFNDLSKIGARNKRATPPCPCGYYGDGTDRCTCGIDEVERYRGKISGPLLDRIDLHIDVPALPMGALSNPDYKASTHEHSEAVSVISDAQKIMRDRAGKLNAHLSGKETEQFCTLKPRDQRHLDEVMHKLGLSARGYYKVLKVARTIADLLGAKNIETTHLNEAIGYRQLDRYRTVTP